jgi:hypothetical protein
METQLVRQSISSVLPRKKLLGPAFLGYGRAVHPLNHHGPSYHIYDIVLPVAEFVGRSQASDQRVANDDTNVVGVINEIYKSYEKFVSLER